MSDDNNFQSMMQNFMKNAKQIQDGLSGAYQQMAQKNKDKFVEGYAGGDMVVAIVDYQLELKKVTFKDGLFNEDPQVVSELVVAAVNNGMQKAKEAVRTEMMSMAQGMPQGNMPVES